MDGRIPWGREWKPFVTGVVLTAEEQGAPVGSSRHRALSVPGGDTQGEQIRPEGKHLPSTCYTAGASVGSRGDMPAALGMCVWIGSPDLVQRHGTRYQTGDA